MTVFAWRKLFEALEDSLVNLAIQKHHPRNLELKLMFALHLSNSTHGMFPDLSIMLETIEVAKASCPMPPFVEKFLRSKLVQNARRKFAYFPASSPECILAIIPEVITTQGIKSYEKKLILTGFVMANNAYCIRYEYFKNFETLPVNMKLYVASSCAHKRKQAEVRSDTLLDLTTLGNEGDLSSGDKIPDDLVDMCGGNRESAFAMEAAIWNHAPPDFSSSAVDAAVAIQVAQGIFDQIERHVEDVDLTALHTPYHGRLPFKEMQMCNLLARSVGTHHFLL